MRVATAPGYHGPRCELCNNEGAGSAFQRAYFDQLHARCYDCGNVTSQATAVFSCLFLLIVACHQRSCQQTAQAMLETPPPRTACSSCRQSILAKGRDAI